MVLQLLLYVDVPLLFLFLFAYFPVQRSLNRPIFLYPWLGILLIRIVNGLHRHNPIELVSDGCFGDSATGRRCIAHCSTLPWPHHFNAVHLHSRSNSGSRITFWYFFIYFFEHSTLWRLQPTVNLIFLNNMLAHRVIRSWIIEFTLWPIRCGVLSGVHLSRVVQILGFVYVVCFSSLFLSQIIRHLNTLAKKTGVWFHSAYFLILKWKSWFVYYYLAFLRGIWQSHVSYWLGWGVDSHVVLIVIYVWWTAASTSRFWIQSLRARILAAYWHPFFLQRTDEWTLLFDDGFKFLLRNISSNSSRWNTLFTIFDAWNLFWRTIWKSKSWKIGGTFLFGFAIVGVILVWNSVFVLVVESNALFDVPAFNFIFDFNW